MSFYITYPAVILAPSPIQFVLNGVNTTVTEDTVTPSNSTPLPVINLNPNGTPVDPSTATNQVLQIAQETSAANSLTNINTKTPSLGKALEAASSPVVLPDTQIALLQNANQGTPNTTANAWPIKVTDGTNVQAVKAASTAAIATDPSSVVALSPNSPLPTGTNTLGKVDQGAGGASAWKVDGSGSIQPVSGTVTVVQPTGTNLHTVVDSSALPTGASTNALQTTGNTSLASIDTKLTGPLPVTGPLTDVQLRASAVPVSMAAVPVGAATAANQTSQITQETAIAASVASVDTKLTNVATSIKQSDGSQKTQVVDGSGNVISSSNVLGLQRLNVSLAAGGTPGAIAPAFTDVIGGVDTATGFAQQFQVDASKNLKVNVQTSALPLLASTSTKQSDGTQKTQIVDPANASITSTLIGVKQRLDVSLAAGAVPGAAAPAFTDVIGGVDATTGFAQQFQVDTNKNLKVVFGANAPGRTKVNLVRNDYGTTPVTTAAYVQLIASTSAISNLCETFDSSGQTLVLAVGAVGSEIDQFYINPGGNGQVPLLIPIASRVSIKAVTATANVTGSYLNLTLYS